MFVFEFILINYFLGQSKAKKFFINGEQGRSLSSNKSLCQQKTKEFPSFFILKVGGRLKLTFLMSLPLTIEPFNRNERLWSSIKPFVLSSVCRLIKNFSMLALESKQKEISSLCCSFPLLLGGLFIRFFNQVLSTDESQSQWDYWRVSLGYALRKWKLSVAKISIWKLWKPLRLNSGRHISFCGIVSRASCSLTKLQLHWNE